MNKKLIIGLVVAILVIASIWLMQGGRKEGLIKILPKEELEKKQAEEVAVGYGWSTNKDFKQAAQEAVAAVRQDLGDKSPEYALLFSSVDYNSEELLKELRHLLGEKVQIYGGTSSLGPLTQDGFHIGEQGALALMAISSPEIDFGVGGADLNKLSAREAGKEAILEAIKNAGQEGQIPQLVMMTAAPGQEEEILLGIEDIIGKEIPIIGGSSADNDITGKWHQFVNDQAYSNGLALTVIYTDLRIGWAFEAGYLRTENKGLITKAKGRVIYEIDNQPAAKVYNEWTGGIVSEKLESGGTILSETTFYPLAKVLTGLGGTVYYLSIHPLAVNLPEKSLTVFANVAEGDEIVLMHGNWELLLNRAQTTPHKALLSQNIAKNKGYFAIYTFCAGTMFAIPEEERSQISPLINKEIGDIPFIGTFTFGEQGFLPGIGNRHGNLVNSIIIFAPKE